ncbi:hypothetical protein IV203_004074 [Nitzschia inconspicua]|uniref:Uncharacterized protein n=1 Tax=Nitzschia inconspicua TaxID=303405 RepID=A0A9K3PPJ0_9STRA|nr:hypothetical protein IV203_004074 [Nitzschia inconspicua]
MDTSMQDQSPSARSGTSASSAANSSSCSGSQQHLQNLRIMAEHQKQLQLQQRQQNHSFPPQTLSVSTSPTTISQLLLPQAYNIDDESSSSLASASSAPNVSTVQEPTRGVRKTSSLRRGAAGYNQLLQSAVLASIETSSSAMLSTDYPPLTASRGAPIDPDDHPPHSNSSSESWESPSRKNKRSRQQQQRLLHDVPPRRNASAALTSSNTGTTNAVPPRKFSNGSLKQRPRDGDDDDDDIMMLL